MEVWMKNGGSISSIPNLRLQINDFRLKLEY